MATSKNFEVKNGLSVGGTQRISSAGEFTGSLASATTATTQSASDNSTKIATTAYTDAAITAVIGGAPGTLDTLNELAAAINDDDSYATTLTTALAGKLPLAGGTLTGDLSISKSDPILNIARTGNYTYKIGSLANDTFVIQSNESSNASYHPLIEIDSYAHQETVFLKGDANGKLGVGATTPTEKVTVNGALAVTGAVSSNPGSSGTVSYESITGVGDGLTLGSYAADATGLSNIFFRTGYGGATPTTAMTIDGSGNVGIGTNPSGNNKLHVSGKGYFGPVGSNQGDTKANMQTNAVLQLKPHSSNSTNMTFAQVNGGAGMGIQVSNGPQTANWDIALNPYGGGVAIGGTSLNSGVKLEVNGGKIYVPGHTVQAQTALIGGHTNFKWKEQPTGNSATAPSANKSAAYIGSNNSTVGIVIQRDSSANTFPDFAITESGYVYANSNITMQNGGTDSADYRAGAPGYVNWGSKIENHGWHNWSGTGNYTARLYTPIGHNESNMFQIEIDVYGYSSGGTTQRYIGGGYAYSGSSLIQHGTVALSGSLTHRLTTATHPNFNTTVVVFDIGYSNNNGTAYYNHMRWRYQGWNGKRSEDFVWAAVTT